MIWNKIILLISLIFLLHISFSTQLPQKELSQQQEIVSKYMPQPPSLEKIFADTKDWTATLSAERVRRMRVTGDVMLGRTVNFETLERSNFTWAFSETAEFLKDADITFVNLENPLLDNCPVSNSGFTFCGDKRHIEGLLHAGVDVVNLANNHAGNYGLEGVEETVRYLSGAGIEVVGVDGIRYVDVDSVRFAFLGYNDVAEQVGVLSVNEEMVEHDVAVARAQADLVIVQFHWGDEYRRQPNTRQKTLGRNVIEWGADVVVGNHPHWFQSVEVYNGGVIAYSHGNFIFDQMWSRETREGVVGTYTFYDDTLIDVTFTPIIIQDFGQARIVGGAQRDEILNELEAASW